MIFVIQLAQHHDALHALLAGKEVEVEHHHLTLELCQRLVVALIIGQRDVDDARQRHLRGINLGWRVVGTYNAHVLHALNGNIVKVLATLGFGEIGVPTGSHGSKHLDIFFAVAGVEDEGRRIAQRQGLEQSKIRRGAHRSLKNIVIFHLIFIALYHAVDTVAHSVNTQRRVFSNGVNL